MAHDLAVLSSVCDSDDHVLDEDHVLASVPTNIQVVIADDSALFDYWKLIFPLKKEMFLSSLK